uniref:Uncharacterized protein n=1 Tax=Molossus molossus TaxID=27622 RepID=A0A7J8I0T0_MOLMO|nr:hypothetical protein HJG59_010776 [Molossus molossus]
MPWLPGSAGGPVCLPSTAAHPGVPVKSGFPVRGDRVGPPWQCSSQPTCLVAPPSGSSSEASKGLLEKDRAHWAPPSHTPAHEGSSAGLPGRAPPFPTHCSDSHKCKRSRLDLVRTDRFLCT